MGNFYDENGKYKGYSTSFEGSNYTYYYDENGQYKGYTKPSSGSDFVDHYNEKGQYKGYTKSSDRSIFADHYNENGQYKGYTISSKGSNFADHYSEDGLYIGYSTSFGECSSSSGGQTSVEDIPWWFVLIGCGILLTIFAIPFLFIRIFISQMDSFFSEYNSNHICYSDEIRLTGSHVPNKYTCFSGELKPGETEEYTIVTEEDYITLSFEVETSKDSSVDISIIREDGYCMTINSSHLDDVFYVGRYIQLTEKGTYIVRISSQKKTNCSVTLKGYISLVEDK